MWDIPSEQVIGADQDRGDPDYHDGETDPTTRVFDATGREAITPHACNTRTGWVRMLVTKLGVKQFDDSGEPLYVEVYLPAPLRLAPYKKEDDAPLEDQNTLYG